MLTYLATAPYREKITWQESHTAAGFSRHLSCSDVLH